MFSLLLRFIFCGFILFIRHNNAFMDGLVNFWKILDDF
jgi:hypothetical protein